MTYLEQKREKDVSDPPAPGSLPHRGLKRMGACAQELSKMEEVRGYVHGVEPVAVAQCRSNFKQRSG